MIMHPPREKPKVTACPRSCGDTANIGGDLRAGAWAKLSDQIKSFKKFILKDLVYIDYSH